MDRKSFVLGRALELARAGDEDEATELLQNKAPDVLVEITRHASMLGVVFEGNEDYIIESFATTFDLPVFSSEEEEEGEEEEEK